MTITKKLVARSVTTLLFLAVATTSPVTQSAVTLVGLGDSIAEGVQSGDANEFTQHFSFVNLIAAQMGVAMPLPLIRSGLTGLVGSTNGRFRIDTTVRTLNLGVSGATAQSILTNSATATIPAEIDTETELVLFPEIGSQIEIAERLAPSYTACWIGNNDVSGSILSFNQLDATQLTPVASFTSSFTELVNRLEATGTKAVFSTIPDISDVGYLLNGPDLIRFLGSDHGLPAGSLTTVGAMLLVKLGLEGPAIFANPELRSGSDRATDHQSTHRPAERRHSSNRRKQRNGARGHAGSFRGADPHSTRLSRRVAPDQVPRRALQSGRRAPVGYRSEPPTGFRSDSFRLFSLTLRATRVRIWPARSPPDRGEARYPDRHRQIVSRSVPPIEPS